MRTCENCRSKIEKHGCTWCNEESYIVDQYIDQDMQLPDENTEFMKKYREQQKK